MDGTHQSSVASVCQWGNNQASTVSKILVAIEGNSVDHFYHKRVSCRHAAWRGLVMLPVVSEHRQHISHLQITLQFVPLPNDNRCLMFKRKSLTNRETA